MPVTKICDRKLYSAEVTINATLYVVAESAEAADLLLKKNFATDNIINVLDDSIVYDETFHAFMPEISLSPAMTVDPYTGTITEDDLVEDFADEDQ